MIGKTISHFKILDKIGAGGMGEVYLAEDTELDRKVALKFLPPHYSSDSKIIMRFKREAKAAAALNHPNIITVYEVGEHEGQTFIAMEYVEGESLRELMSKDGLSLSQVLQIGKQVCEGLAKAHQADIIHRDIKPENIMIDKDGRVRILDFGLAKLRNVSKLTQAGKTLGTLDYMSPEQLQGLEVDHRTDIWSLGVVLYEMITGRLPFQGEYEAVVMYSVLNEEPQPLGGTKTVDLEKVQQIIDKALEIEVIERYESIAALLSDIHEISHSKGSDIVTRGKTKKWRLSRFGTRRYPLLVVTVLIVAGFFLHRFLTKETAKAELISIAVMPFKNMNQDFQSEYFADGVTEDILNNLSKIRSFSVISRRTSMLYKNSQKNMKEIGEELGVRFILEGSVRRENNRVRIVSHLIDAHEDRQLWGDSYDREIQDIFEIQASVAQQIAAALEAELTIEEEQQLQYKPTKSFTAYDYYLKGREYYYLSRKEDNENAIVLFKRALAQDLSFALAYCGLAKAYSQRVRRYGFVPEWADSSIAAANKAIAINSQLSQAHDALGLAYQSKGWYEKSLKARLKAVELDPNNDSAIGNISISYLVKGAFDKALPWAKKAVTLNPTSANKYANVAMSYYAIKDLEAAKEWFKKSLDLKPDYMIGHLGLLWVAMAQKNYKRAIEYSQKLTLENPENVHYLSISADAELFAGNPMNAKQLYEKAFAISPSGFGRGRRYSTVLGYIHLITGERDSARHFFDQSLSFDQKEIDQGSEDGDIYYDMAAIMAIRKNKKESLSLLQKAIDLGWGEYPYAMNDPLFENLQGDERFNKMMKQLKDTIASMRAEAQDFAVK